MVDSDQRGLQWISTEQSSGGQSEYMVSERLGLPQLQQPSKSSSDGPFVAKALSAAGAAFLSAVLVNPLDVAKQLPRGIQWYKKNARESHSTDFGFYLCSHSGI